LAKRAEVTYLLYQEQNQHHHHYDRDDDHHNYLNHCVSFERYTTSWLM